MEGGEWLNLYVYGKNKLPFFIGANHREIDNFRLLW